ncbi:MAG: O-acetyl-ADP-ribose deacetylase [Acidobacteria bacterium]|nr:MAG: O-acetyl-ADP-ribose deacetylase [Acidobacteriota bacterium]
MPAKLISLVADITTRNVDAIVNAANSTLLGGGGVDGAIHQAAGPGLLAECRDLGGCPPGEARITSGYRLNAAWVIHTVGPIWRGGSAGEAEILASCYRQCIDIAEERGIRSLAFPAISTGAYGYPASEAAQVAIDATTDSLSDSNEIDLVEFVCFDPLMEGIYARLLAARP